MNTSLSLPSGITIGNVVSLHADWRAGLADDPQPRAVGFEFRVRADQVDDIDAAGLQLLLSLRRSVQALGGVFSVADPSVAVVVACSALGVANLLAAPSCAVSADIASARPDVFEPAGAPLPDVDAQARTSWHVAFAPGRQTFRDRMDPMAILDDAHRDGVMTALCCDLDRIPLLATIDPESCFLAFEFVLGTARSRREVASGLASGRDDVELSIRESGFAG
jgi:hypothetical protein